MSTSVVVCGVITNRDISSEELLSRAVEEIVESARDNDIPEQEIAEALREQAAAVAEIEQSE
jgi:ribosome-binding protein aMBF1 (putative translation factor)